MKKLLQPVLLSILFVIGTPIIVKASHVMAGDITYKQISGDTLLVTVKIYRDCNGIQLANSPVVVRSEDKNKNTNFTLKLHSVKDVTGIGPNCPYTSRCAGNYTYGIEEHVFMDTVVLPNDSGCRYTLSWEQCCRNAAITTGASGGNFYMETRLNKCLAPVNSSPEFVRMPVILINFGQDISLNHTATDPDNDFVSYELVNPLGAAGTPLPYSGSWSNQKPITFLGFPNTNLSYPAGFRFDTLSGNMSFRPAKQNEATVVTVRAKEWRKISGSYVLIGEVIRDVQLLVVTSPNNKAPKIGNPDTGFISVCTPGTICAEIPITDADSSDTLSINYLHNLPNAVITTTVNSPNNKRIKVCFTPDSVMTASGGSYFFTLFVQDNVCPLPSKTEKTYFIKLAPPYMPLPPLPDAFVCETDTPITLLNPGPGVWSGTGVSNTGPVYKFNPTAATHGWHQLNYLYTDSFSGCYYKDSVRVRVVEPPLAGFTVNDTIGLATDTFLFTNTTTADTLFSSIWNMGDSVGVGISTPNVQYTYNDTGIFMASLWVSNGICPPDSITKKITVVSSYVGINKVLQSHLKIYPTPADNVVYIEAGNNIRKIEITDMLGRTRSFDTPNGGNKAELNLAWLENGVYMLSVTDVIGRQYSGKVLVQR